MKHIVLFGAGKSATCLIDYLSEQVTIRQWKLTVADADVEQICTKLTESAHVVAYGMDVTDTNKRSELVAASSIVISLLPPSLHAMVAADCLEHSRDLLTASYLSEDIRSMEFAVNAKNILFLCEMGLDPGIDHMSAMELFHRISADGGIIHTFRSHCGGLVAPESDNNPWRYKISWNPRNVVLAGKHGADYLQNGERAQLAYEQLFDATRRVDVDGIGPLCYYPNRDSIPYIDLYKLHHASTFVRTTLRYPEFCFGWQHVVELKLTDEEEMYDTDGMTLSEFFKLHFAKQNFSEWLSNKLTSRFNQSHELIKKMEELIEAEKKAGPDVPDDVTMVDPAGNLQHHTIDSVKIRANEIISNQVYEANLTMNQLINLGMFDEITQINKGRCSAADVLQFAIEEKWKLQSGDKDMIVMLHEIGYRKQGEEHCIESSLIVKGEDHVRTAMAKTVGLPLGIATILRLEGKLPVNGLHIPILPAIYQPVLKELEKHQVIFHDKHTNE